MLRLLMKCFSRSRATMYSDGCEWAKQSIESGQHTADQILDIVNKCDDYGPFDEGAYKVAMEYKKLIVPKLLD